MISSFLLTRSPGNGPPEPHIVNTHLGPKLAHSPQLGALGPPHRLQTAARSSPHACPDRPSAHLRLQEQPGQEEAGVGTPILVRGEGRRRGAVLGWRRGRNPCYLCGGAEGQSDRDGGRAVRGWCGVIGQGTDTSPFTWIPLPREEQPVDG